MNKSKCQDDLHSQEGWRPGLIRLAYTYLHDVQAAEDVAQEVLAQASLQSVPLGSPRAWLFTLVRNRCLNRLRRHRQGPAVQAIGSDPAIMAGLTGPLTNVLRREAQAELFRWLATLPENQREVLVLRYAEGLGRGEIAQVLDQPVAVVKSRLYEGLQHLRSLAGMNAD